MCYLLKTPKSMMNRICTRISKGMWDADVQAILNNKTFLFSSSISHKKRRPYVFLFCDPWILATIFLAHLFINQFWWKFIYMLTLLTFLLDEVWPQRSLKATMTPFIFFYTFWRYYSLDLRTYGQLLSPRFIVPEILRQVRKLNNY